jgi:hypothetical protein
MSASVWSYHRCFHTLFILCIGLHCGFIATAGAGAPDEKQAAVSGVVRDGAMMELLSAANIRVLGTSWGTITNVQGRFSLMLAPGSYLLRISMIGYSADTVRVTIPSP